MEADKIELEIRKERERQDKKWGEQNHPDGTSRKHDEFYAECAKSECQELAKKGRCTWRDILYEEVREAFAESDSEKLKTELIQCAAVIKQWIECIERRAK